MTNTLTPRPFIDTLDNFFESSSPDSIYFSPTDYQTSIAFLKQYSHNKATFESYRREVERLIQWSWLIEKKSLLTLNRHDIENYIQFCLKPPNSWIGFKKVTRFITRDGTRIPNPEWRPFVVSVNKLDHKNGLKADKQDYQLSQKAIREIFTVLSTFYNYLALEEKVSINPIALIKQKSKYI